ncbi:MAG: hypothetical protein Q8O52_03005 [Sulfuritalea sp.]|nr:hypothetical protein [Sulfuritalea sp.]
MKHWLHESAELLEAAARLAGATLVHKDPEFAALKLAQEVLPLKWLEQSLSRAYAGE